MNTVVLTPAGHRSAILRRSWALIAVGSVLTVTACTGALAPSEPSDGSNGAVPSATTFPQSEAADADGEPDTTPGGDAVPQPPDDADQPAAVDPAEDGTRISGAVETALQALAAGQSSVTREQVRSAIEQGFADADVVADGIEVSIDSTPTGLDVDAIQGAGRTGETCVFGEVREGDVSVSVLPALASGYCFVGDQR